MNILPKKSWHVRNKDNIERVRRDEAKASEEEKERQRRVALAEQEARTALLRKRAKDRGRNDSQIHEDKLPVVESGTSHHINFFSEYESDKMRTGKNKEHEEEKRQEKEKYEKSIGLLTYLGQNAVECQTEKPWYFKPPNRKHKGDDDDTHDARTETDVKRKHDIDPMLKMSEYLTKKRKKEHTHDKEKHRKHKKHKHKHRSKESGERPAPSIEELRAERLKREQDERQRTERLLAKARGEKIPGDEPVTDDRRRRYNSQFNPDFVRQPKTIGKSYH